MNSFLSEEQIVLLLNKTSLDIDFLVARQAIPSTMAIWPGKHGPVIVATEWSWYKDGKLQRTWDDENALCYPNIIYVSLLKQSTK